jgi:hypothetical protein
MHIAGGQAHVEHSGPGFVDYLDPAGLGHSVSQGFAHVVCYELRTRS